MFYAKFLEGKAGDGCFNDGFSGIFKSFLEVSTFVISVNDFSKICTFFEKFNLVGSLSGIMPMPAQEISSIEESTNSLSCYGSGISSF